MLNEELIDNVEIARLKVKLEQFKKYDKQRKDYYHKALIELGECKSLISEYEDLIAEYKRLIPLLIKFETNLKDEIDRAKKIREEVLANLPHSTERIKVLNFLTNITVSVSNVSNKIKSVISKLNKRIQAKSLS